MILQELRRRRVYQTVAMYVAGAWIAIEVAEVVFATLCIPETSLRYLFIGAALLFPLVVVFAWIFDITTGGLVRTQEPDRDEDTNRPLISADYWKLGILAVLALAIIGSLAATIVNEPRDQACFARTPNSVAVLPFAAGDSDAETLAIAERLSDRVRKELSNLPELHVVESTSSSIYRPGESPVNQITNALEVEYVLIGSVSRDNGLIRVSSRLVTWENHEDWSQEFVQDAEGVLDISTRIAAGAAREIEPGIAVSLPPCINREARDEYYLGLSHTSTRNRGWQQKAEEAFRSAIRLDSSCAPAYAGLAYSLFVDRAGENKEAALRAAEKALELDPDLGAAHAIYGLIMAHLEPPSLRAAETSLRRALELDPNSSDAHNWLAIILERQGASDEEIIAQRTRGYELDPLNPPLVRNLAADLVRNGRFEDAEKKLLRLTRIPNPLPATYGVLWHISMEQGQFATALRYADDAIAIVDQMREQSQLNPLAWQMLSYAALGMSDAARKLLEELSHDDRNFLWLTGPFGFYPEGPIGTRVLQSFGKHDLAWQRLEETVRKNGNSPDHLESNELAVAIKLRVAMGDYAYATHIFEGLASGDPGWYFESIRQTGRGIQAMYSTAYALKKMAKHDAASQILHTLDDMPYLSGATVTPKAFGLTALLSALQDDKQGAYEALNKAIELGWSDYYDAIHDPRWDGLLEEPQFAELLDRVQANLAEQRATIK